VIVLAIGDGAFRCRVVEIVVVNGVQLNWWFKDRETRVGGSLLRS
jgi:hypothetical protein